MTLSTADTLPHSLETKSPLGARYRVLYFMRTADCPVCRAHVKRLIELLPTLRDLGADVTIFAPDAYAPPWAKDLPFRLELGEAAYEAVGFHRTLGAVQQSGTIVARSDGVILDVRRATLPFQAFHERELLALLKGKAMGFPAEAS